MAEQKIAAKDRQSSPVGGHRRVWILLLVWTGVSETGMGGVFFGSNLSAECQGPSNVLKFLCSKSAIVTFAAVTVNIFNRYVGGNYRQLPNWAIMKKGGRLRWAGSCSFLFFWCFHSERVEGDCRRWLGFVVFFCIVFSESLKGGWEL